MKILVLSDVHSNIKGLQAIEIQEKTWDMVLFAGDMVDYGLYPHEVIDWMKNHNVIAVAGNHDIGLLAQAQNGTDRLSDPFCSSTFCQHNLSLLTDDDLEYLNSLPLEITLEVDGITYFMTHIYDEADGNALIHHLEKYHAISSFEGYWEKKVGHSHGKRCLLLGDTHHCMMVQLKQDTFVLNPGSVGYNLGGDVTEKGASYIVVENGIPYFRYAQYSTEEEYRIVKEKMTALDDWQYQTGLAIFKP